MTTTAYATAIVAIANMSIAIINDVRISPDVHREEMFVREPRRPSVRLSAYPSGTGSSFPDRCHRS